MNSTQKLKLGLLLASFDVPAWFYASIERIAASDSAEFSLVILNQRWSAARSSAGSKEFIYQGFNRLDEKIFRRDPDAFKMVNLQGLLADVPVMEMAPSLYGDEQADPSGDAGFIQGLHLDILIQMESWQLPDELVAAARYGVWYCEHGEGSRKPGGPPGFWEVVEGRPVTGAALYMNDGRAPGSRAIYRSRFLTYPFSPARNRSTSFWAMASFLPRQIDLLHRQGEDCFFQETSKFSRAVEQNERKADHAPSNLAAIGCYSRLLLKNLVELYQRVFRLEAWSLMFGLPRTPAFSFQEYKKIVPPKDRFWADPCLIQKENRAYVFVEEYIYQDRKGRIAVIEIDDEGRPGDSVTILETETHLSYPFVFEHENTFYMVPESAQHGSIDLYECVEFPSRWKFKMTLMENVRAFDTTVFFYKGKWWLFTGLNENLGALPEVELNLFYADELLTTNWKAHPLNPVISDVTAARPAGGLFMQDGKLFRPSQDCSKSYGNGFNINEVLVLSETEYLEKKVVTVKPTWDRSLIATHTFSRADEGVMIDVLTRRSRYL